MESGPTCWMNKKEKEKVRGSRGSICENKGECNYKTVEKNDMSQGKNQYSFPKTIPYAKPNRI